MQQFGLLNSARAVRSFPKTAYRRAPDCAVSDRPVQVSMQFDLGKSLAELQLLLLVWQHV